MSDLLDQYDNPKLWKLTVDPYGAKIYVSVPIEPKPANPGAMGWKREHTTAGGRDVMIYTSGEYEIHGQEYGNRRPDGSVSRRAWTVRRQGVELSLSFTGSLRHAKTYAAINARGGHRVNVA